jgi:hypothetical protein
MSDEPPALSDAAEHRLEELLGLLAADQPPLDPAFAGAVVRRARLQRAIVTPLRTVGTLVAAVGDGLRVILGVRPGDGDR